MTYGQKYAACRNTMIFNWARLGDAIAVFAYEFLRTLGFERPRPDPTANRRAVIAHIFRGISA